MQLAGEIIKYRKDQFPEEGKRKSLQIEET